jgi:hypothetical protein
MPCFQGVIALLLFSFVQIGNRKLQNTDGKLSNQSGTQNQLFPKPLLAFMSTLPRHLKSRFAPKSLVLSAPFHQWEASSGSPNESKAPQWAWLVSYSKLQLSAQTLKFPCNSVLDKGGIHTLNMYPSSRF